MSIFDWSSAIKITFDRPIVTTLSEATGFEDVTAGYAVASPLLIASSDRSGYPRTNAVDGNTSTYWRADFTTVGQYIGVDYGISVPVNKLKIRMDYSSGRINAYQVQASDDAGTWTSVASGNFANTSGWQEVAFDSASYRYWRVYATSKFSSYYTVTEFGFFSQRTTYSIPAGWVVSAYEPDMSPGGDLVLTNYTIRKIEKVDDDYSIIIWLDLSGRMKHPQGDVTVAFSGTLQGPGGAFVAPFSLSFSPQNVTPYFNPNVIESIELVSLTATLVRTEITYVTHEQEQDGIHVELLSVSATVVRTHIDDIVT